METITSSAEISRLFKDGRRVNTPELSILVLRNEGQHDRNGRVAFIAGKKLGNAVWRNRAKRRMREACREVGGPFSGYDVAFVARRDTASTDYRNLVKSAHACLTKVGIITQQ